MSPHIHIGPEPVLAAHARSLPAAGSRCPAGADSAPHSEQNFVLFAAHGADAGGTAGEDAFKTLRRVGATHVTENWKAEKV